MKALTYLILCFPLFGNTQKVVSEEITLYNTTIELPGTLSYFKAEAPIPLIVFIHGSGAIDRNGNQGAIMQGNYYQQLAHSLNKQGIACYRYDKRTANPKNADKHKGILLTDFVGDAQQAIHHFKNDKRFGSIHLLGHSQGSLIGMLAINEDIKSFVSVAGPSRSIDKVLIEQVSKQDSTLGAITKQHLKELAHTDTILSINPFLISLFAPQNQKFIKNWMTYDPSLRIASLKLPICIINGAMDLQVNPEDGIALQKAKPTAQLHIIPKMNHVLKTVTSTEENVKSYTDGSFVLSQELIAIITAFIKEDE